MARLSHNPTRLSVPHPKMGWGTGACPIFSMAALRLAMPPVAKRFADYYNFAAMQAT